MRTVTRLQIAWYLSLWLLEIHGQAGGAAAFLVGRKRIRARMHAVILGDSAKEAGRV